MAKWKDIFAKPKDRGPKIPNSTKGSSNHQTWKQNLKR